MSQEYIVKSDDTSSKYQYKLRLWPLESCDLDETDFKKYLLFPTTDNQTLIPSFSFQVNKSQDTTGDFFLVVLDFKSSVLADLNLNLTLGYLNTDIQVPKAPEKETISPALKKTFSAISGSTLSAGL